MPTRRLPSLNALRMFESAARLRSFKLAAEELHVTQSAVSRQIHTLESQLGVLLFRRRNRAVELTDAGEQLLPVMHRAIVDISAVTRALTAHHHPEGEPIPLVVAVSPGLAELWLGERLGRFCRAYPQVEPEILVSRDPAPLLQGRADLALHWGTGEWPGLQRQLLHATSEFPVCSPQLLERGLPLNTPADLRHHRLLHWQTRGWWGAWLRAFNADEIRWNQGPLTHDYRMALEMAAMGEGVALGDDLLCSSYLLSGRLIKPLAETRQPEYSQQLLLRPDPERPDVVAAFRDWIVNEVAQQQRQTAVLAEPGPFRANGKGAGHATSS